MEKQNKGRYESPIGFEHDADAEQLSNYISRMDEQERVKWVTAFERTDYEIIENDVGFVSAYNPNEKKVLFNANDSALTALHETAHAIDSGCAQFKVNVSGIVFDIDTASAYLDLTMDAEKRADDMANFAKVLGLKASNEQILSDVITAAKAYTKWAKQEFEKYNGESVGFLSDIFSAVTNDYIGASQSYGGHDQNYWLQSSQDTSFANKEVWADYAALKAAKEEKLLELFAKTLPNRYKQVAEAYRKAFLE